MERERCGILLPVGEVMQTALNIKAEEINQSGQCQISTECVCVHPVIGLTGWN